MKSFDKQMIILLVIGWILFFLWENTIQNYPEYVLRELVRYDLMALPTLLFFTTYAVWYYIKRK